MAKINCKISIPITFKSLREKMAIRGLDELGKISTKRPSIPIDFFLWRDIMRGKNENGVTLERLD